MDIKSKIASYEAHNEAVRTSTVPSPSRNSVASATSTTSMASHSRRSRIQRERDDMPLRQSQQPPPPGSLAERRRARQQQKQKRLVRENSRSRDKRSVSPASFEQSKPTPEMDLSSNRRFVHSVSMESSNSYDENTNSMDDVPLSPERRLSPAKAAKIHRMQRRKQQHSDEPPPRMPELEDKPTPASPVDPTDDEVTLTSVRQIMQPESLRRSASSSTIASDGDAAAARHYQHQTNTQAFLTRSALGMADDERTFDYGDRDDGDDDESVTYEQRKEAERRAREEQKAGQKNNAGFFEGTTSPLLNTDDMSYYRQTLDTPAAKITAGIVVAASLGTLVLGPVGLLVGAATVGIGVGVMQIPEEQRAHVKNKTVKAVHQAHESAISASEALSTSCATSCNDLGCGDQLPHDMKEFFENPVEAGNIEKTKGAGGPEAARGKGPERSKDNGGAGLGVEGLKTSKLSGGTPTKPGKRRAACLRNARIVPVAQIHGLDPSVQPRAWLDVMASANTSQDEKNEGMEEILILAKDKKHARFFLEEGILDSIMLIITHYLDGGPHDDDDAQDFAHAKLAAKCCVTLGKAHCATVHTEGDLQLMSMYERGTVPEDRQLAQMLYEVPHHVQVAISETEEVFVLKQVPMPQAEELARSIKALADGERPVSSP